MAGISDRAINKLNSQNKFDGGVELEEDYGVNLYSTLYRNYDPQLGRFSGVDALCEMTSELTPYQYATNNPIYWNDPTGLKETVPDPVVVLKEVHVYSYTNLEGPSSKLSFADWDVFISS